MPAKINICAQSTHPVAPKWSLHGKPNDLNKSENAPGPGKYGCPSVAEKYKRAPGAFFGSSQRITQKEFKGQPGPGSYQPIDPNILSPECGFGSAARLPKMKLAEGPPPGKYDVRTKLAGKPITMAGKRAPKKLQTLPGPGQYPLGTSMPGHDYPPTWEKTPEWQFGSSKRSNITGDQADAPGPGRYEAAPELGGNIHTRSCPNFSMKSRRKPVRSDSTPGPSFPHYSQF